MKFIVVLPFIILLVSENDACFPARLRGPLHSYLPAAIQILHHYKDQLRPYYSYAFSNICRFANTRKPKKMPYKAGFGKGSEFLSKVERGLLLISNDADICVLPTDSRFSNLLRDLYREAEDKNLYDFQGFSYRILLQLEKTSNMTSADQLYFIFDHLLKEKILNGQVA